MDDYPESVTKIQLEKITKQIENSIYKIYEKNGKFLIGFLCYINYQKRKIPVLITSYQKINEEYLANNNSIKISINNKNTILKFGDTKYLNKNLDLAIIEINEKNTNLLSLKFLELDERFFQKDSELFYLNETMYIIHYNKEQNNCTHCTSFGVIKNINGGKLIGYCNINSDSNGAPIFNLNNNKLIGIYKNNSKYYAKGIFLKFAIKEFIKEVMQSRKNIKNDNKNEISIIVNVEKEDVWKKIFFLDNYVYKNESGKKYKSQYFKELNEFNTELYINGDKKIYKKYFIPSEIGKYYIYLIFNINLTDCSYMFAGCSNIMNINFISFNTEYVTNMKYMFYECSNLKNIDLFSFNTKNVADMSFMFYHCYKLNSLDLYSFNTKNVTNMSNMFNYCKNLKDINIISFDTKNVKNMNLMFYNCWKLNNSSISCINKDKIAGKNNIYLNSWNIKKENSNSKNDEIYNQIYISIFVEKEDILKPIYFINNSKFDLEELKSNNTELFINKKKKKFANFFIPKKGGEYSIILRFNFYLTDCSFMFGECVNIIYIDFSSFNSSSVTNMSGMFSGCNNLKYLNLSSFNTSYATNMSLMFQGCYDLKSLDLSSFYTYYVTDMSYMLDGCNNLESLNLSSFDTYYLTNMEGMF